MNINWFSILLFVSSFITFFIALITWKKDDERGIKYYSLMLLALSEWAIANAIEYIIPDIPTKIFMTKLSYIGLTSAPALLFSFIFTYTGLRNKYGDSLLKYIWGIPIVVLILAFTNDYHFFLWEKYIPTNGSLGLNVYYVSGVGVWLFAAFCYLVMSYSIYCAIRFFPKTHLRYRWQGKLFILALCFPWLGNILYLTRFSPLPEIDITPLAFSLLGITLYIAISRLSLFDVSPEAKEELFISMQDPVIVLDSKYKVIDFNPAANSSFQISLGINIFDILPEIKREIRINYEKPINFELKLKVNEQIVWHEVAVTILKTRKGTNNGLILVFRNITRRKTAEDFLIKSENELKELNASKDKFFSIMAHDIKNPLSSLKSGLEVASDLYYTFEENERFEFIFNLKASAVQLSNLTENLLTWSRSQTGHISFQPIEFDLAFVAKSIIELLHQSAVNKNITLISEVEDLTPCFGDINMINTVIRNLASNAIKFTPENGEVKILAKLQNNDNEILISVKDNGVGMDKRTSDKLFKIDQSVTTLGTAQEKGTGLGLVLCNEFIIKHNSRIHIESAIGKGSTFSFILKTKNN